MSSFPSTKYSHYIYTPLEPIIVNSGSSNPPWRTSKISNGIGSPQSPNRVLLEREGKKTLFICFTILFTSLLAHFIFYPHESPPSTSHEHETDLNIEMNDSISTVSSSSSSFFDDHDHFSPFHSRPLLPPVFCPSPVLYTCHPHWNQPQLMFGFEAQTAMEFLSSSSSAYPEFGIRVAIAMRDRCCRYENENEEEFTSFFRVLIQSDEVRTASEIGLKIDLKKPRTVSGGVKGKPTNGRKEEQNQFGFERTVTTFVRLPESGTYTVRVLLMLYNISSPMIDTNYEMNSILSEESQGQWINQPVFSLVNFDSSMNITLPSRSLPPSSSPPSLPLCGSLSLSSGSPFLPGRWFLGPWRDPTPYRQGWMSSSQNLFDEYQLAQWVPLDCRLDKMNDWQAIARTTTPQEPKSITAAVGESSSQTMVKVLSNLQWIHIVGDSNARHLFMTMCEMITGAVMHSAPQNVQSNDPPFSCTAPGMDKSESEWVITYTNWFVHKHWPLPAESTTFGEQCSKYSDQPSADTGAYEGWPGCSVVSPSVSRLSGPGLTYFVWGSHAAEWGATKATEEYFQEMLSKPYFSVHPTLFALTTACDSDLIPTKFGKQFLYRNNERIDAVNRLLIRKVKERIESKEWKWMEGTMKKGAEEEIEEFGSAVDVYGKVNGYGSKLNSMEKWLPLLDVFSPTYAVYERLSGDPVHFWSQTQQRIALLLMHYAKHAPNWRKKQV